MHKKFQEQLQQDVKRNISPNKAFFQQVKPKIITNFQKKTEKKSYLKTLQKRIRKQANR